MGWDKAVVDNFLGVSACDMNDVQGADFKGCLVDVGVGKDFGHERVGVGNIGVVLGAFGAVMNSRRDLADGCREFGEEMVESGVFFE